MAGTEIVQSLTQYGSSPGDDALDGRSHAIVWWNAYQSRWDGVIPWDESPSPDTVRGNHYVAIGIKDNPPDYGTEDTDLNEFRGSGRPTIYWDNAGKLLHVVSSHNSQFEYWRYTYDDGGDTYTMDVGLASNGEDIPGMERTATGMPIGIIVTPNGLLWVASLSTASGLHFNMRSAGVSGSWNGSAIVIESGISQGCTTMNYFTDSGVTNVWVFCSENDGVPNPEWNAHFLDQDDATPFATAWTEDSWDKTGLDTENADNHCASVRLGETILIAVKTDSTTVTNTLIGLWERLPDGTILPHNNISDYSATAADRRSRPSIAVDIFGWVYVPYNQEQTADLNGWYKRAHISDLDTWEDEVEVFSNAGDSFTGVRTAQADFAHTPESGLMLVAERIAGSAALPGEDLWYNEVTVPNVGLPAQGVVVME